MFGQMWLVAGCSRRSCRCVEGGELPCVMVCEVALLAFVTTISGSTLMVSLFCLAPINVR